MSAYPIPSAEQQLVFLKMIQRLFTEGEFVATYKFALISSLVELAIEGGDDTGEPLELSMREIAEKFAELYWPQTAPYINGQPNTEQGILGQNLGKQAAVVNHLSLVRDGGAKTLVEARKHPDWNRQIARIASVIRKMPVTFLQNMGGSSECFLFDVPGSRAPLRLKPGVMYNLRRFQGFIQQLARAGWISHVRGNKENLTIIGESSDLESFMFLTNRSRLNKVAEFLKEYDGPFCFYCRKRLRDQGEVDHFIPWSLYPRDTGHNFVLAHKGCNGRKRDTLAASIHLKRWIDRNAETDVGFQGSLEEAGFITNWQGTLMIARWAYKQGTELRSRAWISDLIYESVDDTHTRLLG